MSSFKNIVVAIIVILATFASGCFSVDGGSCGFDLDGNWYCDVGVGDGTGTGGYYDYYENFVVIEWDSGNFENPEISVTSMDITCEITEKDSYGDRYEYTVAADIQVVDGYMAYAYLADVGPLFDAECYGSVAYNNGPRLQLFDDDSAADGNVTQVYWEDDVVSENDVRESNYEFRIDRL
ncbi:hypothetical protein KJ673_00650 [Patescibacteria group bacterium]|nr:hypothetical protein [Patescibacteria group bacterium]MBU4453002.1 hypothetical protein [Patescibacteria group bacterium]MCG2687203.1 hypothetical protein [Candidatus Parcubacteria bacterium]